ncbi:MAG: exopolyphosphatase [Bacteroidota bacterium]|jgi:exopolyphosphatase/guanosine-5'-triphosphate,3'-diphosphate pyrophosphatase
MILAAIDIGSNAARLLISEVTSIGKESRVDRLNFLRIPLRLGFDVFEKGYIGARRKKMLIDTIDVFARLISMHEVDHYIACATSAMRDASNSKEIIREIRQQTGIGIDIISGDLEAEIIYENHIAELLDPGHSYLYIDVGGGSTELTFYHQSEVVFQRSFNVGTIRMLTNQMDDEVWQEMKLFLRDFAKKYDQVTAIGSGGNINKLASLVNAKSGKSISAETVREMHRELSDLTVEERMLRYKLKRDRADVIVPALLIYTHLMKWGGIEEIYVPKIGLADGLIHHLREQLLETAKR